MAPSGATVRVAGSRGLGAVTTGARASGNATILIYLSLFLLLLVFFIVLNVHSVPREYRVKAVLGSVERSFAVSTAATADRTENAQGQGTPAPLALAGLKRLGGLFETDLAIVKVDTVSPGRLMVASMPIDELFEDGSTVVRSARMGLLDRISREIGDQGGVRFEMDFLIAVGGEPLSGVRLGDPVAQAAAVAHALIADRAPPDALSVGIEPGQGGTVRFLFSARTPAVGASRVAP